MLKRLLRISTLDLKGVYNRLVQFWPLQHRRIADVITM
jgi:hypothetical protein